MTTTNKDYAIPESASADCRQACEAIIKCLKKHKALHSGGQKKVFYTAAEWTACKEEYEGFTVLIVAHDGGEHASFFNPDYGQYKLTDEMREALKAAGFWSEACTSWYTAIYKSR